MARIIFTLFSAVSIRSPHRSKGRPAAPMSCPPVALFQSAPLTEARGDNEKWQSIRASGGFNPLPPPKQGETGIAKGNRDQRRVSIRSPHRSKGRLLNPAIIVYLVLVSIRSPHRSKGRQAIRRSCRRFSTFQSAPLTEARGDLILQRLAANGYSFNPLPSPKQGETEENRGYRGVPMVSIRSPHRSKGRQPDSQLRRCKMQFQSAPLTEARGDQ